MILELDDLQLVEVLPAAAQCLLTPGHHHADWAADYPLEGTLTPAEMLLQALAEESWQPGFAMHQLVVDGMIIGDIGFHAAPLHGLAELGYGIVPAARGKGYATRAVIALAAWAIAQPGVTVTARPDHAASRAVLVRAGVTETTGNVYALS